MATSFDLSSYQGIFKRVYSDKIKNLIPDGVKVLKRIEFVKDSEMQGESYRQPVQLGYEHGFSYGGNTGVVFNLSGAIAGNNVQAEVKGHELILESNLALAAISRSKNSEGAFVKATKHLVKTMMQSMYKRLEVQMIYGQQGLATVASVASNTITVTTAEWAAGIWNGAENMVVEVRSSAGVLRGQASVTSIDSSARTITLNSMPAGTTSTDVIWAAGSYNKEFAGLHKINANTGSLFGIDGATYNLWKGNTYSISPAGSLSFSAIEEAIALCVNKGQEGDMLVLCSPQSWNDLVSDVASKRRFDGSYNASAAEYGHESIKFHSQNGSIEIVPSIHVKEGYAYLCALDEFKRVGSSDVSFDHPAKPGQYIVDLQNSSGVGLRLYTDQALFCEAPGRNALIDSIT